METLIPVIVTGIIGIAGIVSTLKVARLQATTQVEMMRAQLSSDARRDLRDMQSEAYSQLLAQFTEVESHADYFERLRRGYANGDEEFRKKVMDELGGRISEEQTLARLNRALEPGQMATRVSGEFDHVKVFRELNVRAAQVKLVASPSVAEHVPPAVSATMRVAAGVVGEGKDRNQLRADLKRMTEAKSALLKVMIDDIQLR